MNAHADALVTTFAISIKDDEDLEPALREEAPAVARRMLEWKVRCADRRLERWTLGDLRELLLDWFPHEAAADGQAIEIAADAVPAFLAFLDQQELLDAPVPLMSLEAAVANLIARTRSRG